MTSGRRAEVPRGHPDPTRRHPARSVLRTIAYKALGRLLLKMELLLCDHVTQSEQATVNLRYSDRYLGDDEAVPGRGPSNGGGVDDPATDVAERDTRPRVLERNDHRPITDTSHHGQRVPRCRLSKRGDQGVYPAGGSVHPLDGQPLGRLLRRRRRRDGIPRRTPSHPEQSVRWRPEPASSRQRAYPSARATRSPDPDRAVVVQIRLDSPVPPGRPPRSVNGRGRDA